MKKLLASIFAVFAFGMAAAQPPMGPPPGMMPGMGPGERGPRKSPEERIAHVTKELGLTEKQAKKFAPSYLAYQGEMEKIRKDLKKVMEYYEGKELTEKLAFRKVMDQLSAEADMVACKKEYMRVFKNLLTPEQLTKILMVERKGNRPPRPPHGDKMPPMGPPAPQQ